MSQRLFTGFLPTWATLMWLLLSSSAQAQVLEERPWIIPVEIEEFPRTIEAPKGWWDFFKERIRVAGGFDEAIHDNVFLRDNDKQEDYISTLEAQLLFADPRGSLLYGTSYEVNALRYHIKDVNAINHDVLAFADFDPGGRVSFRTEYALKVTHTLLLGPEGIDILRRSTDFQRLVEHHGNAKLRYSLNDTNALVPQLDYLVFDDQFPDDAETDRREFKAILDLDHDVRPGWTLSAGYVFEDREVPGNTRRSFTSHGGRLGSRYELTDIVQWGITLEVTKGEFNDGLKTTDLNVRTQGTYQAGPRTTLTLHFDDERKTSFAVGRLRFRTTRPSFKIEYALTPLTDLVFDARYEKQRSGGRDVVSGSAASTVLIRLYDLHAGMVWRVREKSKVTLDYNFSRSRTRDYTAQVWTLGFETEF